MKKVSIIIVFLIGYIANAQSVIIGENIHNGRSRDLNTGDLISTDLSARIEIEAQKAIVTLTVEKAKASYNIDEIIIYGDQKVLNCSNLSQKIQVIYNDIKPTFITVSEENSDFAFFVDIIKHKNLNLRNNGTTKKKFEKIRS